MRGLLLAAGRGSRMGALTDDRPKCLTPLAGRTLLEWQLAALAAAGLDDIGAIGGYRADLLEPYVDVVALNARWSDSNMVTTLCQAADILSDTPCIVSYSDIVYRPDPVAALMAAPGDIAIAYDRDWLALWAARFDDPLSDAESFRQENGRLLEIGARCRSTDDIEGQYMGLLKITPAGWRVLDGLLSDLGQGERDRLDMTALIQRLLADGIRVDAVPVGGGWCEVDSADDARLYERLIDEAAARGEKWSHDWRWQQ